MNTPSTPSTFDFTDHQVRSTPGLKQATALSTYQTPENLIRDVFHPSDSIEKQTDHSLEVISKKQARAVKVESKAKHTKSTSKSKKDSDSLRTTKPKKLSKAARKKLTSKKSEQLTGKGFNIRHF